MKTEIIHNTATGRAFKMRFVPQGERYGRRMCLTHDEATPMVEFYDTAHPFDVAPDGEALGQFVSRYSIGTIIAEDSRGLNLHGGEPAWQIDSHGMKAARAIMARWMGLAA